MHAIERELLSAIYRRPDDDSLRHVYADWLNERGDPRGELIALQLAPSRTESMVRRERLLLGKYRKASLGGLGEVVTQDNEFRRGFLARATARFRSEREFAKYAGSGAWGTVEELSYSAPPMFPVEESVWRYGMSAAMVGLRAVDGHAKALVAAGATFSSLQRATLRFDDIHVFRELAASACAPNLRALRIDDGYAAPEWLEGVTSVPWVELRVRGDERVEEWLAQASRVGIKTMVFAARRVSVTATPARAATPSIRAPEAVAACKEGVWVAEPSRLVLVDANTGLHVRQIETNASATRAFARGASHALLVMEAWSELVSLADGKTLRFPMRVNARSAGLSNDARIAIAGNGNFCEVWDVQNRTRLASKSAVDDMYAVSGDGAFVAFGANPPPGVSALRVAPRARAVRLGTSTRLTGLCFLANGTLLSAHGATGLRWWNPVTGEAIALPASAVGGSPAELVASPVGTRVAFRPDKGAALRVLDLATGATQDVGAGMVWCFTLDGAALIVVDDHVRVVALP